MGMNDAAEMLVTAQQECVRLERENATLVEQRDEYAAALLKVDAYIERILETHEKADEPDAVTIAFDLHQYMVIPKPSLAERDAGTKAEALDGAAAAAKRYARTVFNDPKYGHDLEWVKANLLDGGAHMIRQLGTTSQQTAPDPAIPAGLCATNGCVFLAGHLRLAHSWEVDS